jgi:hypothetical protein
VGTLDCFLARALLLVRSHRLKLFARHCEECMMHACGAMQARALWGPP